MHCLGPKAIIIVCAWWQKQYTSRNDYMHVSKEGDIVCVCVWGGA